MIAKTALSVLTVLMLSCIPTTTPTPTHDDSVDTTTTLAPTAKPTSVMTHNYEATTIIDRFDVPTGYRRVKADAGSFADYLRHLPLKPHGSPVMFHFGSAKPDVGTHAAVVNLPIGKRDLHQCADAIMRLRAEYLWHQKRYDEIHFNFVNGFNAEYDHWRSGKRIAVKGNKAYWTQTGKASDDYPSFWKYMEMVFSYAGTLSLAKELSPVDINDIAIGDIFIQGGSPGHAIIVVDMALHEQTGDPIIMLAQSYMPAQELHLLNNVYEMEKLGPWFALNEEELKTPDWFFKWTDLKRFP